MKDDPDIAFPAQVIVTPRILGEAFGSILKQIEKDPDEVNRMGMGLLMFVEILQVEAKEREENR